MGWVNRAGRHAFSLCIPPFATVRTNSVARRPSASCQFPQTITRQDIATERGSRRVQNSHVAGTRGGFQRELPIPVPRTIRSAPSWHIFFLTSRKRDVIDHIARDIQFTSALISSHRRPVHSTPCLQDSKGLLHLLAFGCACATARVARRVRPVHWRRALAHTS